VGATRGQGRPQFGYGQTVAAVDLPAKQRNDALGVSLHRVYRILVVIAFAADLNEKRSSMEYRVKPRSTLCRRSLD
jgi:hypothetical protein